MNPLQEASSEANRKSTFLIVAGVVCLILLIAILAIAIQIRNKPSEHKIEEKEESIDCTDFDPCTRDFKVRLHKREKNDDHRDRDRDGRHHDNDHDHDEHHRHHEDCDEYEDDDDHHDRDDDDDRDHDRYDNNHHKHHRRRKCHRDICIHERMVNGSCCNKEDYCYYDDPCKKCVFGVCQSPNASLCKGFCNTVDDCKVLFAVAASPD